MTANPSLRLAFPMTPRKRGKNLNITRLVEILNAEGAAAEIAVATGYSVSTIRKVRRLEGPIGDMFRLDFVANRMMAAGLIEDRDDLFHALPEDDEIAAVIGLHHWRKCRAVIQRRRRLNAVDGEIAGLKIINGCVDRFIERGGRLG